MHYISLSHLSLKSALCFVTYRNKSFILSNPFIVYKSVLANGEDLDYMAMTLQNRGPNSVNHDKKEPPGSALKHAICNTFYGTWINFQKSGKVKL